MSGLILFVLVAIAAVVGLIAWAAVSINRDDDARGWEEFDREIKRVLTKGGREQ